MRLIHTIIINFALLISFIVFFIYLIEIINLLIFTKKVEKEQIINNNNDFQKINMNYIIIPCLNEANVIGKTIDSFCNNKLSSIKIYVVDDDSTDNTSQIIKEKAKLDDRVILVQRRKPNAQEGKGESLNYAYKLIKEDLLKHEYDTDSVLVTVMDADTMVNENYFLDIQKVMENKQIDGIQTKVKVLPNSNRLTDLTHMQDLEFSVIFNKIQAYRSKLKTAAFGGNGQILRLSILQKIEKNGKIWTKSLVEDYELTLRIFLNSKVNIKHISDIVLYQSGISKVNKLIKQRARWAQGNIEEFKNIINIIKSKNINIFSKIEITKYLFKPYVTLIVLIIIIATLNYYFIHGYDDIKTSTEIVTIFIVFVTIFTNIMWSTLYIIQKEAVTQKKTNIIFYFFYLIYYMLIINLSYVVAFFKMITHQTKWDKTER